MMTATYLLQVFLMLALVTGMAVGALWLARKLQPGLGGGAERGAVRIVDAIPVGMTGGRLAVVEFAGKRYLIGVNRGRMDLLAEAAPEPGGEPLYIDDGE